MEDNKLPIQIEVKLDERSVGISMDRLEARLREKGITLGRTIGNSVGKSFDTSMMSRGVMQYERELDKLIKTQRTFDDAAKSSFGAGVQKNLRGIALLTTELTRAFFGLSVAIAAVGLPAIIGGRYLASLETAKNGMAGILISMAQADGKTLNFASAAKIAEENIRALGKEAVRTGNDSKSLIDTFRGILAPGFAAGMDIEQIRKFAVVGGAAVRAIGLPVTQQLQELRDLTAGGIMPASSTLATSLGLRDADIKRMKESAKGLFVSMMELMEGFANMTDETFNTLSGKFTILQEVINQATAKAFVGTFDAAKSVLDSVTSIVGDIDRKTGDIKFNPSIMEDLDTVDKLFSSILYSISYIASETAAFGKQKISIFGAEANLAPIITSIGALSLGVAAVGKEALTATVGVGLLKKSVLGFVSFVAGFKLGEWFYENFAVARKIGMGVVAAFVSVKETMLEMAKGVGTAFGAIKTTVGLVWEDLIDTITTRTKALPDAIKGIFGKLLEWLASGLEKLGGGSFATKLMSAFSAEGFSDYDKSLKELAERQEARGKRLGDAWKIAGEMALSANKEAAANSALAWGMVSDTRTNEQIKATKLIESESKKVTKLASADAAIAIKAIEDVAKKLNADKYKKEAYTNIIENAKEQLGKLNDILANPSGKSTTELGKIRDQVEQLRKFIPDAERGLAKLVGKEQRQEDSWFVKQTEKLKLTLERAREELERLKGEFAGTSIPTKMVEGLIKAQETDTGKKVSDREREAMFALAKQIETAQGDVTQFKNWEKISKFATDSAESTRDYVQSLRAATEQEKLRQEYVGKSDFEIEILKLEHDTQKEINKQIDRKNKLLAENVSWTKEQKALQENVSAAAIKQIRDESDARKKSINERKAYEESFKGGVEGAFEEYVKTVESTGAITKRVFLDAFKSAEDALVNFVKTGKLQFGSFVNSVIDGLIRMAVRAAITNLGSMIGIGASAGAAGGIGGFMSSIGKFLGFANGGTFGPAYAFANGGAFTNKIYSKPTPFQFADGGKFNLGVMGEGRRSEAVMPLEMGPKGLGVVNYGGEPNIVVSVQVNVDANGNADTQVNAQGMGKGVGDVIGAKIKQGIIEELRPGGLLNRNNR